MRFVPTFCLRDGMILGKSLFSKDGGLLLNSGQTISSSYITKIHNLGYQGVYIFDNLSEDIVIESIIDDELRFSAIKAVKDIYIFSQSDGKADPTLVPRTKTLCYDLVDQIIDNKQAIVNMIDLKVFDDYTFYHSVNVAVLSIIIGVRLDMPRNELYRLGLSALLHDIGKVFIPKEIIDKKCKLTNEEFDKIKKHTTYGYNYLRDKFDIPSKSYLGALQHHEKYDGTGYPECTKGENISNFGRIISVADVYDALTSDRPYRKAMPTSEVMEYIMGGAGSIFDPNYVYIFTRKVAAYPLGTCVRLSNGLIGIAVENFEDCCMRPKIKIITEDSLAKPKYIDLKNDREYMNVIITDIEKM